MTSTMVAIISGACGFFMICTLYLIISDMLRFKRSIEAIRRLASHVKDKKEIRQQQIKEFLQKGIGYPNGSIEIDELSTEIQDKEISFYKSTMKILQEKNAANIENFTMYVDSLLQPYHKLICQNPPAQRRMEPPKEIEKTVPALEKTIEMGEAKIPDPVVEDSEDDKDDVSIINEVDNGDKIDNIPESLVVEEQEKSEDNIVQEKSSIAMESEQSAVSILPIPKTVIEETHEHNSDVNDHPGDMEEIEKIEDRTNVEATTQNMDSDEKKEAVVAIDDDKVEPKTNAENTSENSLEEKASTENVMAEDELVDSIDEEIEALNKMHQAEIEVLNTKFNKLEIVKDEYRMMLKQVYDAYLEVYGRHTVDEDDYAIDAIRSMLEEIKAKGTSAQSSPENASGMNDVKARQLQDENKILKDKYNDSITTMNRLYTEYAYAFDLDKGDGKPLTLEQIKAHIGHDEFIILSKQAKEVENEAISE